ncbi:hypothetical protein [Bradyrhizobium japonicum]|nr:hypothetical protein [Bradyrhizobium japonicum]MBR0975672.1 hypothetical protein [Bradyrhizobium japonicum]
MSNMFVTLAASIAIATSAFLVPPSFAGCDSCNYTDDTPPSIFENGTGR